MERHAWIVDHYDDVDADFLAIYRIDLDTTVVGAKRFMALASRLPAYEGALALTAAQQSAQPDSSPDGAQEVPVEALNLMMPGLIDRVEVTPE